MKKITVEHVPGGGAILIIDGKVVPHVLSLNLEWDASKRRFRFVYTAHVTKPGQFPPTQEETVTIPDFTLTVRDQ